VTGGKQIGRHMISRQVRRAFLPPAMYAVAPSREWRLPWERERPPFRPFINIWQAADDVERFPSAIERGKNLL
jgi:hypothetical protein